jgi:hypothetical protein
LVGSDFFRRFGIAESSVCGFLTIHFKLYIFLLNHPN